MRRGICAGEAMGVDVGLGLRAGAGVPAPRPTSSKLTISLWTTILFLLTSL